MSLLESSEPRTDIEKSSIFALPRPATAAVLLADPDLARGLDRQAAAAATRVARARTVTLETGRWQPKMREPSGALGMLILDGLICRSMMVGGERSSELLGAGDLMRPWSDYASSTIPARAEYEVLAPTQIALLDRSFARAITPWPELHAEIVDRALRRCRSQAVLVATSHIKRVDVRLLALLFHLADRWGRVTPNGIVVPVKLTHAKLASLVGAQRPSVTTALSRMASRGVLTRNDAGHFVLGETAQEELEELCLSSDARHLRLVHRADPAAAPSAVGA